MGPVRLAAGLPLVRLVDSVLRVGLLVVRRPGHNVLRVDLRGLKPEVDNAVLAKGAVSADP